MGWWEGREVTVVAQVVNKEGAMEKKGRAEWDPNVIVCGKEDGAAK